MKNIYEVRGKITAIFVYCRSDFSNEYEALIDTIDLEKVSKIKNSWCLTKRGYVHCKQGGKTISLHRHLLDDPEGLVVDHINNNRLDNRKSNLRAISQKGNNQNRNGANKNSKTGIRNVSWAKQKRKWKVSITMDWKDKHIGYFDNLIAAEEAASVAREQYMEFSKERGDAS